MNSWEEEDRELRRLASQEALRVLIWGPGDPGSGAKSLLLQRYQKRVKMRDAISAEFTNSDVKFSEDDVLQRITEYVKGDLRKEAIHAKLAHVVLILDISRGADLELDHFVPTYSWFRNKAYVFLPERYVNTKGLVADVLKRLPQDQIQGFTDAEFDRCDVATVQAVQIVQSVAILKLLSD